MYSSKISSNSLPPEDRSENILNSLGTSACYIKKREVEEYDRTAILLKPYSSFLVRYPSVVVIITIIVLILSAVLSVFKSTGAKPYPNFGEPTKGYEARGTLMSSRRMSMINLRKAYRKGILVQISGLNNRGKRSSPSYNNMALRYTNLEEYSRDFLIVYEPAQKNSNMFRHMKSVCSWYKRKVISSTNYYTYMRGVAVHHIPNYIALLSNRNDCEDISTSDVDSFVSLLKSCVGYYKNESFLNCKKTPATCDMISTNCRHHQYINNTQDMSALLYNVFHFLADISLMENPTFLKSTMSFDFIQPSVWMMTSLQKDFFRPLYESELKDLSESGYNNIKVTAFQMWRFKFHLFKSEVILQSMLAVAAILLVILLTWFYTGSLFIGLMTFSCILFALIIAYFVYTRVFNMPFFPFLNMTTIIFIIGIGADDAFVYTGIWEESKRIYKIRYAYEHEEYMIKWTTHSIRHATIAMLVTSLTTAAAFYANITSTVTSVKCFGLYAGTAIIINYLLMITFFPCVVILHDKYFSKCMHYVCPLFCKRRPVILEPDDKNDLTSYNGVETNAGDGKASQNCQSILDSISYKLFNKHLPYIICKFKFIFIPIFFLLGIGGMVVTFGKPGLNPPSTSDFQMFSSSSSLEQYSLYYKERYAHGLGTGSSEYNIEFVFGVNAVDNGNKFDPDDRGSLVLKNELDIASVQVWLRQFCNNLRTASFYVQSWSCYTIEQLFEALTQPCGSTQTDKECCGKSLPMGKDKFLKCFRKELKRDGIGRYSIYQPLFDEKGNLRTLVINATTNFVYSSDFHYNKRVLETLEKWTKDQMKNVTSDSFNGWWNGEFRFYDLQRSLFDGTELSLGIAVAVAFVVILMTSLNLLLSLYSILTITFIISVTVGVLVLSGWYLNIVESTVFSVAAGLSADFTLHYSVAYRTSLFKDNRDVRVQYAISHIGPAVFMGAITTFIGGVVMIPSTVLSYVQMGHFLMVVMFFSWVFSTFFFLPLCAAIGPVGYFGEIICRKKKKQTGVETEMSTVDPSPQVIGNQSAIS